MKKNITINLFGTLFAIDEDACLLLEQYTDNMKSYFGKQPGGDEIADDIEHRIAELLWEHKQQGNEAVDIETIKRILEKIGNPEQMEDEPHNEKAHEPQHDENAAEDPKPNAKENAPKKLYRDSNDKMVGGVLSGVAHYFGATDPLAWRIGFVMLVLIGSAFYKFIHLTFLLPSGWYFVGITAAYVAAWMLIPEATTAEERLTMNGKPVNPKTIKDEVLKEQAAREGKTPQPSEAHGCANGCLSVLVLVVKLFVFAMLGIIGLVLFVGLMAGVLAVALSPSELLGHDLGMSGWVAIPFLACLFTVVALPFYGLLRLFFSRTSQKASTNLTLFAIWLVALVALFPLARYGFKEVKEGVNTALNISVGHLFGKYTLDGSSDAWMNDSIVMRNEKVEPFTKLRLEGVGTVMLEQCDSCYFWAEGHSNILDNTTINVMNDELVLKTQGNNRGGQCTFHIGAPYVELIDYNGVGDLHLTDDMVFDKPFMLTSKAVGNVMIEDLSAPSITLDLKGVGSADANVDCQHLDVTYEGVGGLVLHGKTSEYKKMALGIAGIYDDELTIIPIQMR